MGNAKVIVLANVKGGPGKTTMAIHLADFLSSIGGRVLLVDADPQQSLVKWNRASDGNLRVPVFANTETHVHKEISKILPDYDYVVVDTPPSALAKSDITKSALLVADLAIVPITPSVLDIWEAVSILELIEEVNESRVLHAVREMDHKILLNKVKSRTNMARDIEEVLNENQLSSFETKVAEREIYKQAAAEGLTVLQMPNSRSGTLAKDEIAQMGKEVMEILQAEGTLAQPQT